ncbi:MAG: hypothetical protein U0736_09055 [Gemmataceae bacterium]
MRSGCSPTRPGFYDVLIDKVPAWTPAMAEDHGLAHLRLAEIEEQVGSLSVAITKTTRAAAVFADLARTAGHRGIGGHRADVQERLGRLLHRRGALTRRPSGRLAEAVRWPTSCWPARRGKADLLYRKARFLSERGRPGWRRGRGRRRMRSGSRRVGCSNRWRRPTRSPVRVSQRAGAALSNQGVRAWEEKRTARMQSPGSTGAHRVREPLLARHPDSAAALTGLADVCNNLGALTARPADRTAPEAAWNRCQEVPPPAGPRLTRW